MTRKHHGQKQGKGRNTGLGAPKRVEPMTRNQEVVFNNFRDNHIVMHGYPGTGKSFLALYLALRAVEQFADYERVIVLRSTVAGRDAGFLPGSLEDKTALYEEPYIHICKELFERDDAYIVLKKHNVLTFRPTTALRGLTFDDSIVIVDEAQNMSDQELHTIITRLGENSKLVVCGDVRQDDLTKARYKEQSGLAKTLQILAAMREVTSVEFGISDIVRSDFIRDYIIARAAFEDGLLQQSSTRRNLKILTEKVSETLS